MKILYGIQGTGNGHLSRARLVAEQLAQRGADVQYLISGRDKDTLFDMDVFGDYWHREGLTMQSVNGRISTFKTAKNLKPLTFIRDVRALDLSTFDVVVCDYEPVTAWAAKLAGKPCIGLAHQCGLSGNVPSAGPSLTLSLLLRYFAPVSKQIGLHWHPYEPHIAPPIVDTSMTPGTDTGRIVVYLPWEDQAVATKLLQQLPEHEFIMFSSELSDQTLGNVIHRKANLKGFKQELCGARGVISNAGFELVSEALFLGKPTLTRPIAGQAEQMNNAAALEHSKLGASMREIDLEHIKQWLEDLSPVERQAYPNVASKFSDWLLQEDWESPETFASALWENPTPA